MQTKFDVGDNVKTVDGVHDKNLYGEISGIQIGKDKEKYSVTIGDECEVYDKNELTQCNENATKLRKLADLIDSGEIEVLSLEKGYGFRDNKLNNGIFTNISVNFIENGD